MATPADSADVKPTLVQSSYTEKRSDHTYTPKSFDGSEPRPECPDWNHGDGAPEWKNSGWVYAGVLYECRYDDEASLAIHRKLSHQYAIDFEVWAGARIAMLENASRATPSPPTTGGLRHAWEAGIRLAIGSADNAYHIKGDQADRLFAKYLSALPSTPSPLTAEQIGTLVHECMTRAERVSLFGQFCRGCGDADPK